MTADASSPEWITRFTEEQAARIVADEVGEKFGGAVVGGENVGGEKVGGASDGPLSGVRFAAKDNIDVAGVPSSAAFPARGDTPAGSSAFAVRRLLRAGAVPAGKTNLDQFATGLVGTRSPFGACHAVGHPEYVSGGSSSGS